MRKKTIVHENAGMALAEDAYGHLIQPPAESMYNRIMQYKKRHPDHRLVLDAYFPYASAKYPNSPILARAPGLGEMIIHEAKIISPDGVIVTQAKVVQYYHSMFDFPSKVMADAIWLTGEAKGPRYCKEEIDQIDLIVSPGERVRLMREKASRAGFLKEILKTGAALSSADEKTDEIPWYAGLDEMDQRWVENGSVIDHSEYLPENAKWDNIPDALRRIGIGGEKKTYTGEKAFEVIEAFESRYAPKGAIYRNRRLLEEAGFEFNIDRQSKKWAMRISETHAEQIAA